MIVSVMDWFLYTLLTEKQKSFLANLFTDKQKEKLKKVTKFGKRHTQRRIIEQIKYDLYNLGFTERAYAELKATFEAAEDLYLKRLAAWELTLWHTNMYTKKDATMALQYIQVALDGEKDGDQLRKGAIIKAECLERLDKIDEGIQVIQDMLSIQKHPDLYLAMANLEEQIDDRLTWINKALSTYELQPIYFESNGHEVTYDDLRTEKIHSKKQTGPKVSVILPAYNFESGIHIAIDSILTQTWENIELLIVDDCSTDHTVEVIKQYMEKDDRVKLFHTPVNSGPYVARNIALKAATGEYVTVNDADDWSHAEKLETQVTHLIENNSIIANTSGHARLTEELKLYRRGTPGIYIFPNMSSLMFRRKQVIKELGSWDSVRFAADGEFKRRLLKAFGKEKFVDLQTGPLSLPRQSVHSLTGSPAFGYNGFFMGARREYVESLEYHHEHAETLHYPFPLEERPFPVPEPMWPSREEKEDNNRLFDIIIATDFRNIHKAMLAELKALKQTYHRIGLVQMSEYGIPFEQETDPAIRELIDGKNIQMIVYGETVSTDVLFVINEATLTHTQRYVPEINASDIHVLKTNNQELDEKCLNQMEENMNIYFGKTGTWHEANTSMQEYINKDQENNLSRKKQETMMDYVE